MKTPFHIVHIWGRHCKNCKKIFEIEYETCQECGFGTIRVMCAIQVPRGCIFVYNEGRVPGSQHWIEVSDEDFVQFQEAVNHQRPGSGKVGV
jgi:hypothetical protein